MTSGAQRYVELMDVPLAVIASGLVGAVLVPYGSPLKWMASTPLELSSPFNVIYVGAGILAISILLATRRGSPPGVITTVVALIAILVPTFTTGWAVKVFAEDGAYWTYAIVFVIPIALSLVVTFRALRMRGWDRMLWLLGGVAIAALPYGCPRVPGMFNLSSGGVVYVIADLTVLALFIRGT